MKWIVVAILLLITYRSPWLWLVPLITVGLAEQVTTKLVALIAPPLYFLVKTSLYTTEFDGAFCDFTFEHYVELFSTPTSLSIFQNGRPMA